MSEYREIRGSLQGERCEHKSWADMCEKCEIDRLRADNERLRAALRDAYEVYAGSDGFIPETAAEGYQQQIIRQMVDCISAALEGTEAKRMERSDND